MEFFWGAVASGEYNEKQLIGPEFVVIWALVTSRLLVAKGGMA